jgi:hypothetical protein
MTDDIFTPLNPPAARKVGLLTIDRIRDPPAVQKLKRHGDRSLMRSTGKRMPFTRPTRHDSTPSSTNWPYSQTAIGALECHPETASASYICNDIFEAPINAAHVLRNYNCLSQVVQASSSQSDPLPAPATVTEAFSLKSAPRPGTKGISGCSIGKPEDRSAAPMSRQRQTDR